MGDGEARCVRVLLSAHLRRHGCIRIPLATASTSIATAFWLLWDQGRLHDEGIPWIACDQLTGLDSATRKEPL